MRDMVPSADDRHNIEIEGKYLFILIRKSNFEVLLKNTF